MRCLQKCPLNTSTIKSKCSYRQKKLKQSLFKKTDNLEVLLKSRRKRSARENKFSIKELNTTVT